MIQAMQQGITSEKKYFKKFFYGTAASGSVCCVSKDGNNETGLPAGSGKEVSMGEKMTAGTRELNLEEMGKVSGGAQTITVDGTKMSKKQFNDQMASAAYSFGFKTACNMVREATGWSCAKMSDGYAWPAGYSDVDKINEVLSEYWG